MDANNSGSGIFVLWLNWLVAIGTLVSLLVLSIWIPEPWMPLVALGLGAGIVCYMRRMRLRNAGGCGLTPWLILRTMSLTALTMLIINVCFSRGYADEFYDPDALNLDLPYVSVLIQAPMVLMLAGWVWLRGDQNVFCRYCSNHYGTSVERGFIGMIYAREAFFQIKVLFVSSLIIAVETWIYYWICYVNVNFNSSDVYFLVVIPALVRLATLVYMGMRYFSLWGYYYQGHESYVAPHHTSTLMRYLILYKDNIYLGQNENHDLPGHDKLDTPGSLFISHRPEVTLAQASTIFREMAGLPDEEGYRIRFMYGGETAGGRTNIFHYIVVVADPGTINDSLLRGQWIRLNVVQDMLDRHKLAPMLVSEIARLHRVTMAWKTYDINGRRLYHIKNYKPMFRLNGVIDWDVDFNDPRWLEVSRDNEDMPLFHLRRLWRRVIRKLH